MVVSAKQNRRKAVVLAAPHSGSGKTMVTLGLLRALKERNKTVQGAKIGPDYIDAAFHEVASGAPCMNLDPWAMGDAEVARLASYGLPELLVIEGVMGLFDGPENGHGSTADVAASLGLPVILVVDAKAQAQSVAALLHGFRTFRGDVAIEGVIFNRVGSARHERMLKQAAHLVDMPVLGSLPNHDRLRVPSRHLGLVQAGEHDALERFMEAAAALVSGYIDLDALVSLSGSLKTPDEALSGTRLSPLGQRVAIARDQAFGFSYTHVLQDWRDQGAEISFFSPLMDETPGANCDAVFLPGGYPELHAEKLTANDTFLKGLRSCAGEALIYGECGGFMVLGEGLIDETGKAHQMAGLLPVTTSFEKQTRHLGYRVLSHESPLPWPKILFGHEFHYSTLLETGDGPPLFEATTSNGEFCGPMGIQKGRVMGSYAHVIAAGEAAL